MPQLRVAIIHYTAPPVVGGVEAVIQAHARLLRAAGHAVTVIAGEGAREALASGAAYVGIPELGSNHPRVQQVSRELEQGRIPAGFEELAGRLQESLRPLLRAADRVIVHNVFTKHFNLPLTAAIFRLLDRGELRRCVAWCHDFTWTSASSRSKVHPGYPWDLLRSYRADVTYAVVSRRRQLELAGLLGCPVERIRVAYNGVDPQTLLGLSDEGLGLIDRLGLWESDLVLLMPVRVTQAKNIELALQVTAALKRQGLRPRLIVTGPPDPHDARSQEYYQSLLELRRTLQVEQEMQFVYESGPEPGQPLTVAAGVIGDLFRVSDVLFMPSHREGFGMPVVEAGLAGLPIFCTAVPAADEIASGEVNLFSADAEPQAVAVSLAKWAENSATHRLRRRVRQTLTWDSLYRSTILPLLEGEAS